MDGEDEQKKHDTLGFPRSRIDWKLFSWWGVKQVSWLAGIHCV